MPTGSPASNPIGQPVGSTIQAGISIVDQPLSLSPGLIGGAPAFVKVITSAAGLTSLWSLQLLGQDNQIAKYYIGTPDGQYWWSVPSNSPYQNCVSLVPGQNAASTIILNLAGPALTLEAPYQPGGFMAPVGGSNTFYFATNAAASSPIYFAMVGAETA